jgi:hypothetical protein
MEYASRSVNEKADKFISCDKTPFLFKAILSRKRNFVGTSNLSALSFLSSDYKFRLAVGSFIEEYNNKISLIQVSI